MMNKRKSHKVMISATEDGKLAVQVLCGEEGNDNVGFLCEIVCNFCDSQICSVSSTNGVMLVEKKTPVEMVNDDSSRYCRESIRGVLKFSDIDETTLKALLDRKDT